MVEELFSTEVAEEMMNSSDPTGGQDTWMDNWSLQLRKELTFKRGYMKDDVIDANAKCRVILAI